MRQHSFPTKQSGYVALSVCLGVSAVVAVGGMITVRMLLLEQRAVTAVQASEQARLLLQGCARIITLAARTTTYDRLHGLRVPFAGLGSCVVSGVAVDSFGDHVVQLRGQVSGAAVELRVALTGWPPAVRAQSESP